MFVAGLDVGTTGCKIAVFSDKGTLMQIYYEEYNVKRQNGAHEIDFNDVKSSVLNILKSAANDYKITSLGVTSFGETFALLDKDDNILLPSMLYTDPRGKEQIDVLTQKIGREELIGVTGVCPNQMYSIYKLMWIKENRPEEFKKAKRVLLGEDFIVYTLTGNAYIDYSLASRTAAFDIDKKIWFENIFKAADIDVDIMSKPVECGTVAGVLKPEVKRLIGIDYELTVVNGCHDQVAAMIGAGVFKKGRAMDGTGTVECIPVVLDEKPIDMSLYEKGYAVVPFIDNKYACYALSFTGGATLKWFRDNFAELEKIKADENGLNVYAKLDNAVSSEPSGILILPHFAGAATPYMDDASKACFLGITLETTKLDIYKALMEGTSYEIKMNFDILQDFTGEISEIRATGGGASSDVWLQIKADILDSEIVSLDCNEVGAAGTAALAGAAVGVFNNLESIVSVMAPKRKSFLPQKTLKNAYKTLYKKYQRLYNSVRELI